MLQKPLQQLPQQLHPTPTGPFMRQGSCWQTQSAQRMASMPGVLQAARTPNPAEQATQPGRPELNSCQPPHSLSRTNHTAFFNQQQQLLGSRLWSGSSDSRTSSGCRTPGERLSFGSAGYDGFRSSSLQPFSARRASADWQTLSSSPVCGDFRAFQKTSSGQQTHNAPGSGLSHRAAHAERRSFGFVPGDPNTIQPRPISAPAPGSGSSGRASSGRKRQVPSYMQSGQGRRQSWEQSSDYQLSGYAQQPSAPFGLSHLPSMTQMISPPQQFLQDGPAGLRLSIRGVPDARLAGLDMMQPVQAPPQGRPTPTHSQTHHAHAHNATERRSSNLGISSGSETQNRRLSLTAVHEPWTIRKFCRRLHDICTEHGMLESTPPTPELPFPTPGSCIIVRQQGKDLSAKRLRGSSVSCPDRDASYQLRKLICVGEEEGSRTGKFPEIKRTFLVIDEDRVRGLEPHIACNRSHVLSLSGYKHGMAEVEACTSLDAWTLAEDEEPCF